MTSAADHSAVVFRHAPLSGLSALDAHELYQLRADVFVREQGWAHNDVEDVDAAAGTRHLLARDTEGTLLGVARLIDATVEGRGVAKLGRICLVPQARGTGLSALLLGRAVDMARETYPGRDVVLDAQERLVEFYRGHGFRTYGEAFLLGGIGRQPMVLPAI